jgi:hypothetical protein
MNTVTPKDSKPPKAARRRSVPRGRRCLRCPFCAPSGACLDTTIKSGRCGDWVFYLLHGKQFRHLWVKPRDPRTPSQRHWRARLSAASREYSQALTDEQQDACIAAGARRRSRRRLAQSGPLTGQQWWVRSQCAGKAKGAVRYAQTATNPLRTQEISRPTWDTHRDTSVAPPWQHRGNTRRASLRRRKSEVRSPKPETNSNAQRPITPNLPATTVWHNSGFGLRTFFGLRPSGFGFAASAPRPSIQSRRRWPRPPGCSCRSQTRTVEAGLRHRRGAVQRERGPPEQTPCNTDDDDGALVRREECC